MVHVHYTHKYTSISCTSTRQVWIRGTHSFAPRHASTYILLQLLLLFQLVLLLLLLTDTFCDDVVLFVLQRQPGAGAPLTTLLEMTSSSSWQGHPPNPMTALLELADALPLQGNLPAPGGEMPTAPASLREAILHEVWPHRVHEVLSTHTHNHPVKIGGPVCDPLKMLLHTR